MYEHAYIHMYTYVCVYICIHIYVYMYTYICVYIHMYMYTYMCMLWIYCVHTTYIYTHKWIHCVYTRHRESAWERDRLRHNTCLHTSVDRGRQRERERETENALKARECSRLIWTCVCAVSALDTGGKHLLPCCGVRQKTKSLLLPATE